MLTISKQRCSLPGQIQIVLEKFKEDSKLIAHGNGTEYLRASAQTEIKPQPTKVAKQHEQKLWQSSKGPDSVGACRERPFDYSEGQ